MTYYLHRKNPDLPLHILAKYGNAMGYDFSDEIPEMRKFSVEEHQPPYTNEPTKLEEAIRQKNEWKEKYFALLEKYLSIVDKDK
ncbi:MAG TPA: hypothetical protein VG847_07385 [Chitinophagaceae bacterium]|nr:hypothetical protein [Chitinophagaceae bacterium]